MFIIFDLDGTLANIEHRLHFIKNGRKNWDQFYLHCQFDEPIVPIIKTFQTLKFAHRLEIWTGRSKQVWKETQEWLRLHDVMPGRIRMREEGDYTPDHILKEQWLHESIYLQNKPDLVFEDRSRMIEMWRKNGVQAVQVSEGNF